MYRSPLQTNVLKKYGGIAKLRVKVLVAKRLIIIKDLKKLKKYIN